MVRIDTPSTSRALSTPQPTQTPSEHSFCNTQSPPDNSQYSHTTVQMISLETGTGDLVSQAIFNANII